MARPAHSHHAAAGSSRLGFRPRRAALPAPSAASGHSGPRAAGRAARLAAPCRICGLGPGRAGPAAARPMRGEIPRRGGAPGHGRRGRGFEAAPDDGGGYRERGRWGRGFGRRDRARGAGESPPSREVAGLGV